jgi:hypothetical protein
LIGGLLMLTFFASLNDALAILLRPTPLLADEE